MDPIVKTKQLAVSSSAFVNRANIPQKYTCQGINVNPPLIIKNTPGGTQSLAIIMEDPDAPKGTFAHWVVWNIKPGTDITENKVPGTEGTNSFGNIKYEGPCPPEGSTHHYHFKVFALDTVLDLKAGSDKGALERAMKGHIVAQGELVGLYSKTSNR